MLLKGKLVADKIKLEITDAINECKRFGRDLPKLAILRVGSRPDDIAYEARVLKNCAELGIAVDVHEIDQHVDMKSFLEVLQQVNEDRKTHGILVFRPLPDQLDMELISRMIKPEKDIDCMSPINAEKIFTGDRRGISPCTPEAVIRILQDYQYDLTGKKVVIINRSMVLGKPLAMLFLHENATVTICHSKTKQLEKIVSEADIVVTGAGKAKNFGKEFFAKNSIVIDVGINLDGENKLCGDVDFDQVSEAVQAITPVPGGVGTVTSMVLLKHVIQAMEIQRLAEQHNAE